MSPIHRLPVLRFASFFYPPLSRPGSPPILSCAVPIRIVRQALAVHAGAARIALIGRVGRAVALDRAEVFVLVVLGVGGLRLCRGVPRFRSVGRQWLVLRPREEEGQFPLHSRASPERADRPSVGHDARHIINSIWNEL